MERVVVGISGASGIVLGFRAVHTLLSAGYGVDLVMTRDASLTAACELESPYRTIDGFLADLPDGLIDGLRQYKNNDFTAPVASGSYRTLGMIIVPCSMATVGAVASGLSDNLLRRAADVTLKERRRLVLVPREAPLSEIHLENMLRISRVGGVIVPPVPGWYTGHKTLGEVEDFIVGRALDSLGIFTDVYPRWEGVKSDSASLQSS